MRGLVSHVLEAWRGASARGQQEDAASQTSRPAPRDLASPRLPARALVAGEGGAGAAGKEVREPPFDLAPLARAPRRLSAAAEAGCRSGSEAPHLGALDRSLDSLLGAVRSLDGVCPALESAGAHGTPRLPVAPRLSRCAPLPAAPCAGGNGQSASPAPAATASGRGCGGGGGAPPAAAAARSASPDLVAVDISQVSNGSRALSRSGSGGSGGVGGGGGGMKERMERVVAGMGAGYWIWLAVMLSSVSLRALGSLGKRLAARVRRRRLAFVAMLGWLLAAAWRRLRRRTTSPRLPPHSTSHPLCDTVGGPYCAQ